MADEQRPKLVLPSVALPEDQAQVLEDLEADLDRAEKEIETLAKLGLGVEPLRERLRWAREARDALLEFRAPKE